MRKLGYQQVEVLGFLDQFNGWWRYPIPPWNIVYTSMTERILKSLVPHGLAEETADGYKITPKGKAELERRKNDAR